ncbi:type II toxin-antitoxin system prevent-host-death family antitoxin [Streptomyces sp. MUM 203J]|uniref:type II toxin-antitoxin system Phd/YefM family antitoxin n=1 Tax=Streptomyces sp. MUM 203J TaxID=2791990 RepID=UPI001F0366FA|nr:type II toxin-antitoxin system prevent-host-death family antitoxin [Streptomyces sp. MUM 203J]MCH0538522.1 type II toxin-antitoxin system prevent-host-death family antitoxin [Streptomyces sp. MUM 203J]
MKLMTASEASRNFASVLDMAEHGETIVITRGGRRLALIGPAPVANGGDLADALAAWRERHPGDDPAFEADVLGARDLLAEEDPWRD